VLGATVIRPSSRQARRPSREPAALTREEVATAQALADVATIAPLQSRAIHDAHMVADELQEVLKSGIAIDQAKGIIAERLECSTDKAFTRLRRDARNGRGRLGSVAQDVIDETLRPEEILETLTRWATSDFPLLPAEVTTHSTAAARAPVPSEKRRSSPWR
jgi:ANTAR domain